MTAPAIPKAPHAVAGVWFGGFDAAGAVRWVAEEKDAAERRPPGPTPGYRCTHGLGYKCAKCYAQPGEVPYL